MKSTLRIISCALCVILLICCTVSCQGSGEWRTDLSTDSLVSTIQAALPAGDGWETVSNDYISPSAWGERDTQLLADGITHTIVVSSESDMNIDEIGIFRAENAKDAAKIKGIVNDYLEAKKLHMTPLLQSYNQAELPKLDCAEITMCGQYVFYTVLNAEDTTTAHSTFEKELSLE